MGFGEWENPMKRPTQCGGEGAKIREDCTGFLYVSLQMAERLRRFGDWDGGQMEPQSGKRPCISVVDDPN